MASAAEHGIVDFELVVVNLYPVRTDDRPRGRDVREAIEQIDIGGPSHGSLRGQEPCLRYDRYRALAVRPVLEEVCADGCTSSLTASVGRRRLSPARASTTRRSPATSPGCVRGKSKRLPADYSAASRRAALRYGENPHQSAALYAMPSAGPHSLVNAEQLTAKNSPTTICSILDAAIEIARSLPQPGVAVLKHNNPCGAATGGTLAEAVGKGVGRRSGQRVWLGARGECGGRRADGRVSRRAGPVCRSDCRPRVYARGLEVLTTKPKWKANVRLLRVGQIAPGQGAAEFRQIDGGLLCQAADDLADDQSTGRWSPTRSRPTPWPRIWRLLGPRVGHVKSNAIVLARDGAVSGCWCGPNESR